jgi:hypothetical protein
MGSFSEVMNHLETMSDDERPKVVGKHPTGLEIVRDEIRASVKRGMEHNVRSGAILAMLESEFKSFRRQHNATLAQAAARAKDGPHGSGRHRQAA